MNSPTLLSPAIQPRVNFGQPASLESVERVAQALTARGFTVELLEDAAAARTRVVELLPPGAAVFTAASETLPISGIDNTSISPAATTQSSRASGRLIAPGTRLRFDASAAHPST